MRIEGCVGQMVGTPSQVKEEGLAHPGLWEACVVTSVCCPEKQAALWEPGLGDEGGDGRAVGGAGPRVGLLIHSFNKQMFSEHLLCAKPCGGC